MNAYCIPRASAGHYNRCKSENGHADMSTSKSPSQTLLSCYGKSDGENRVRLGRGKLQCILKLQHFATSPAYIMFLVIDRRVCYATMLVLRAIRKGTVDMLGS